MPPVTILQCNVSVYECEGIQRALDQKEANILLLQEMSHSQRAAVQKKIKKNKTWDIVGLQKKEGKQKTNAAILVKKGMRLIASESLLHACYAQIEGLGAFISFCIPLEASKDMTATAYQQLHELIKKAHIENSSGRSLFVAGTTNCRHSSWSTQHLNESDTEEGEKLWKVLNQKNLRCVTPVDMPTYPSKEEIGKDCNSCIDVAFAKGDLFQGETYVRQDLLLPVDDGKRDRHYPILHCRGQASKRQHSQVQLKEPEDADPFPLIKMDTDQLGILVDKAMYTVSPDLFAYKSLNIDPLWSMLRTIMQRIALQLSTNRPVKKNKDFIPDLYWSAACTRTRKEARDVYHAAQKEVRVAAAGAYDREDGKVRRAKINRQAAKMPAVKYSQAAFQSARKEAKNSGLLSTFESKQDAGPDELWPLVAEITGKKVLNRPIYQLEAKGGLVKNRGLIEKELVALNFPGFCLVDPKRFIIAATSTSIESTSPDECLFTPSELEQAVMTETSDSTGTDRITSPLLQKFWTSSLIFQYTLLTLYNMCFSIGQIPSDWRKARVSINHEVGHDPNLVSSYKATPHLPCASNVYDRMLLGRLQYVALNQGLSSGHKGGLPGTSAEDAIAEVMQSAIDASKEGKRTVMTGFNFKESFRNVQHSYLLRSIEEALTRAEAVCGRQPKLLANCKNWLQRRSVCFTFNGETGAEWSDQEKGTGNPQGSPLKSILSMFYIEPLLRAIEAKWPKDQVLPITSGDDFTVLVMGEDWEVCADVIIEVHQVIRQWAKDACFSLKKAFLLPMGGKQALKGSDALKGVGLASGVEDGELSLVSKSAKTFGVLLNSAHGAFETIRERKAAILSTINEFGVTKNSPPCIKIPLAKSLLFSTLEHGLWGFLPMLPAAIKELEEVDLVIVSWILGLDDRTLEDSMGYRSLCVHLGILPIMERIWLEARKAGFERRGYRCTTQTELSLVKQGQNYGPWDIVAEGITLISERKLTAPWERESPFDKVILASSKEEARACHDKMIADFRGIRVYTAGFQKGKSLGSGLIMRRGVDAVIRRAIPNESPALDAVDHGELLGLEAGLREGQTSRSLLLLSDNGRLPSFKFFTDKKFLVKALQKPGEWTEVNDPLSGVQLEAKRLKAILAKGATLELVWIPGQVIEGNIASRREAQRAVESTTLLHPPSQSLIPVLTEAMSTAWSRAREEVDMGRTALAIGASYSSERGSELRDFRRNITALQTRRRVAWLGGNAFSAEETPERCTQCHLFFDASFEAHLLLHCSVLKPMRDGLRLYKAPNDSPNWLFLHPKIDEYLERMDAIKGTPAIETAQDEEELAFSVFGDDEPIPISQFFEAEEEYKAVM